jgi:hypothetical protein
VTLLVVLPQDAEVALDEALVWLRLPDRLGYGLLVAARVVAGVPADFGAHGAARRALELSPGGLRGVLAELPAAVGYATRAARRRWRGLWTAARLNALGSSRQRSMYRSVAFGRNGRYVLVAGALVAVVGLLIGLI